VGQYNTINKSQNTAFEIPKSILGSILGLTNFSSEIPGLEKMPGIDSPSARKKERSMLYYVDNIMRF